MLFAGCGSISWVLVCLCAMCASVTVPAVYTKKLAVKNRVKKESVESCTTVSVVYFHILTILLISNLVMGLFLLV
jgi:hypothetical protein